MSTSVGKPDVDRTFYLDSDSEPDGELSDERSDEFVSRDDGKDGEEVDDGSDSDIVMIVDRKPSFSRASVNVPEWSKRERGGGCRNRGSRGAPRKHEKQASDCPWTEEGTDDAHSLSEFKGSPGIKVNIARSASAWDYFSLFVAEDMVRMMEEETNLYAARYKASLGPHAKPRNLLAEFTDVTFQEMKLFLGLLFLMGIIDKPGIHSYWTTDPLLETPIFGKTMSRDRFEAILMAFHLNDNALNVPRNDPSHDELFKIRPLVTRLQERFQAVYSPRKNLTVSESVMPSRLVGPQQSVPSGIKMYVCCERMSSYVCRMEVLRSDRKREGKECEHHGPDVVRRLTAGLHGKGHTVYMDSCLSSPDFFAEARKKGTTMIGVRKNRPGSPSLSQLADRNLQKGPTAELMLDMETGYENNNSGTEAHAVNYWDEKSDTGVYITCSSASPSNRSQKNTHTEQLTRTTPGRRSRVKGEVEPLDQYLQCYPFSRSSWKWWKRACFDLLHLAKVQAWLVSRINSPGKKTSQLQFTQDLIRHMLSDTPPPKTFKRTNIHDPPSRLKEKHFLSKVPATHRTKFPSRVCVVCSAKGKGGVGYVRRKRTRYECRLCNKGLCIGDCFESYHTNEAYK